MWIPWCTADFCLQSLFRTGRGTRCNRRRAHHSFRDWEREFQDLDVLVSSTAAPHLILTPEKLAPLLRTRRHRPLFLIDLAIPRDINPAVHNLDGVYLYDLDALQSMAERTLEVRRQEAENCHRLIEQHVLDFQLWIEQTQPPGFLPLPAARRTWE